MTDFPLIDLYSQRKAVARHIQGMSIQEVIDWMRHYGMVTERRSDFFYTVYDFQSHFGFSEIFYFTEDGELVIAEPR